MPNRRSSQELDEILEKNKLPLLTEEPFDRLMNLLTKRFLSIILGQIFIMGNLTSLDILFTLSAAQRVGYILNPAMLIAILVFVSTASVIALYVLIHIWFNKFL